MQNVIAPNDFFAFMQWAVSTASFLVGAGVVLIRSAFARR